jgi:hypothetical protein
MNTGALPGGIGNITRPRLDVHGITVASIQSILRARSPGFCSHDAQKQNQENEKIPFHFVTPFCQKVSLPWKLSPFPLPKNIRFPATVWMGKTQTNP